MNRQAISDILHPALFVIFVGLWIITIGSFAFIGVNMHELGELAGQAAIITLWIVSIPGIFKRFQVKGILQDVQIVLMRSRRRIGDIMFTLAVMHYLWMRVFLFIEFEYFPQPGDIPLYETLGFMGLFLLLPLFITSNNFSVKLLKKGWHWLHRLIYIAMWLIAFHVSLQGEWLYAIPTFAVALLQAMSWINFFMARKKAMQPAA